MKNILITGGAGFIGSNLALKLISKGYVVTVLDNLSPQIHGENPKETSPLFLSIRDKVKFIEVTSFRYLRKAQPPPRLTSCRRLVCKLLNNLLKI